MEPWHQGLDMTGVEISEKDLLNGCPRTGDMIAIRKDTPKGTLKWLVSKTDFMNNWELAPGEEPASEAPHIMQPIIRKELESSLDKDSESDVVVKGDS